MTSNQIANRQQQAEEANKRVVAAETARSNRARETETERSNRESEGIKRTGLEQEAQNIAERERHNRYTEKIDTVKAITGGVRDVSGAFFGKAGALGSAGGIK